MSEKLAAMIAGEIVLSKDPAVTLKKWREIFEISQTELAKHLGITSSTLSDYESGRRKSPGINVIKKYVNALIEIDKKRGAKIISQLQRDLEPLVKAFNTFEFIKPLDAQTFAKKINASVLAKPKKLKSVRLYGFTIIDSIKFILEVPLQDYLKIYGKTPDRALIFQQVETGRSPMIAIRISRVHFDIKPAVVVLHSKKSPEEIDKLAIKIAENENIPLLLTSMPIEEMLMALKKYYE